MFMEGNGVDGIDDVVSSEGFEEDSGIGLSSVDDLLNTKQKILSNSSSIKYYLNKYLY